MRVPLDHLSFAGRVLSGFNGATTLTVGDITFLVRAGPVTQQVLFSVVEDLGPYNAILGRVLRVFCMLKLFPSVGTKVVKHYITVGVHRSFPQGVVS